VVIGTGASAIQIAPAMASQVAELYVVQRTPAWITPRNGFAISPLMKKNSSVLPFIEKVKRESIFWLNEFIGRGFIGSEGINAISRILAIHHLQKQVKDKELVSKFTPQYKIGCKRILRSDDFYPIFNQSNVHLITEQIAGINEEGIVLQNDQKIPADAIIWATGFMAADIALDIQLISRHSRNLMTEWREEGAEAFKGTVVNGFPQLYFLLGPNTGLGHNSVLHIMESQMNFVIQCLRWVNTLLPGAYIDIQKEVQKTYNENLQKCLINTVWSSGCKSWYIDKAGKNTTIYPGLNVSFRRELRRLDKKDFDLINPSA